MLYAIGGEACRVGDSGQICTHISIPMTIIHKGMPVGGVRLATGNYPVAVVDNIAYWDGYKGDILWLVLTKPFVENGFSSPVLTGIREGYLNRNKLISLKPHLNLKQFSDEIDLREISVGTPLHHIANNNHSIILRLNRGLT